jgi:hypothetical protein
MATSKYFYGNGTGSTVNFSSVPWSLLNNWLSAISGNVQHVIGTSLPFNMKREAVVQELENRRKHPLNSNEKKGEGDYGRGNDWREFENDHGYTHLEELLIYQPKDWKEHARELIFRFECNVERKSCNMKRTIPMTLNGKAGK